MKRVLTPGVPGCSLLVSQVGQLMGNDDDVCSSSVGTGSIMNWSSARNSSRHSGLPQVSGLKALVLSVAGIANPRCFDPNDAFDTLPIR